MSSSEAAGGRRPDGPERSGGGAPALTTTTGPQDQGPAKPVFSPMAGTLVGRRTPRIKFCGFTRPEDVRAACDLGVDLIGLNLARGPRRIDLLVAISLARLVPPGIGVVALSVNADAESVLAQAAALRAAAVQLHGEESPEVAGFLRARIPVIRAFRIATPTDLRRIQGYPADAYLLDAAVAGSLGGTGVAWDHTLLAGADLGAPVILAGGLHAGTVATAITTAQPWAVDAASGIESAPGCKDAARMAAFCHAVRG